MKEIFIEWIIKLANKKVIFYFTGFVKNWISNWQNLKTEFGFLLNNEWLM
jgi:hypothetical protein